MTTNITPLSEEFKMQAAAELGLAEKIKNQGWGALTSKEIGEIVKLMIEKGEKDIISLI